MSTPRDQSEILQVAEASGAVYFLRIDYEEGDIASAIGHVFRVFDTRAEGEVPVQMLATNETLRTLWTSPSGALWTASADGVVGTTASVRWPAPASGADFLAMNASPPWTACDLPRIRSSRLPPNVTALWGTSDADVYAGTYGGHVYRWDGKSWTQSVDGPGDGNGTIRAFGGSPGDVFAVGAQASILHFDGTVWRTLNPPGPANGHEGFTAVHRLPGGDVLIAGSGDEGRLLHGTSAGLTELGRYGIELVDMAALGDRVLFATGDGVAELFERDVRMIKSSFRTASVSSGIGRLFFIEPAQDYPGFVEYDPRHADAPWWGVEY